MDLSILFNGNNYTLHVNSYNSKAGSLNITFLDINKTYELYISSVRDLRFSNILKTKRTVDQFYYKYNVDDVITSSNRNLKILEKVLISNTTTTNTKAYRYLCLNCSNIDTITAKALNRGSDCLVCSHKKTVTGINDINTTHLHLTTYFCDNTVPFIFSWSTRKKFDVKCPDCGYIKRMRARTINESGFACPICGDGKSWPSKFVMSVLAQLNLKYTLEYYPIWIQSIKKFVVYYDFYIPKFNCIIEVNGPQHTIKDFCKRLSTKSSRRRTLEEEIANDALKKELATNNGIENYIVIDAQRSELDWIKNSILNSELPDLISLENIDWKKCSAFANSTLVISACKLWMHDLGILKICEKLHLSRKTIRIYLKSGAKLGWCNYDSKNAMKESKLRTPRTFLNKAVVCLETGEIFPSIKDASAATGANSINIGQCCKNKRKSSGNFHWMYEDSFKTYTTDDIKLILQSEPFIINLDTLEVFNSIKDAQLHYNSKGNITLCCQGKYSTACGYRWMYYNKYKNQT
ncbi:hypothetical protein KPL37_16700 [Clostridium frigoris]|uniref:Zinc-ribbon domain-containing protein n=1 Tax=Clostridium frigoris TaxID=205327 RepID=A0ABS6BXM6_9CLOT|nr:hypothetical protein [Clostridium frigoris]MBU3161349.1 hypothetical protein [Clostridium frigoris]